jgi:phosphoserine aminotransferase
MIHLTPGPSQLYPTVATHIHNALEHQIPSMSHRSTLFEKLYTETEAAVKQLLNVPAEYAVFFNGVASEWWERIVQNTVEQHSFHFVNGSFSKRFYDISKGLGKNAKQCEVTFGNGFTSEDLQQIPKETELICFTHNETSSGVITDSLLFAAARKQHPHALIAVDIVSSCPCVPIDFTQIDCAFFSVQKAFGIPAGLGVCILSPQALAKAESIESMQDSYTGSVHSFASFHKKYLKKQTPATPNILGMYVLGKVCQNFIAQGGQDALYRSTQAKHQLLQLAVKQSKALSFFVTQPTFQSPTVTTLTVKNPQDIIQNLKAKGFAIGGGYGAYKDTQIRIANFPAIDIDTMKQFCEALITTP